VPVPGPFQRVLFQVIRHGISGVHVVVTGDLGAIGHRRSTASIVGSFRSSVAGVGFNLGVCLLVGRWDLCQKGGQGGWGAGKNIGKINVGIFEAAGSVVEAGLGVGGGSWKWGTGGIVRHDFTDRLDI